MKGILRKKWFWVVLVLVIIGAAVVWLRRTEHYDLTVSYETTRLLGPLNEDGTVNYVAALNEMYGQGVTHENNAAVLLIQAFGPKLLPEATRNRMCELLGISPPPEKGDYFVSLNDYAEAKLSPVGYKAKSALQEEMEARREKARTAPWSATDDPLLAEWLKSIAGPLGIITAASKRPRYYVPMVSQSQPPNVLGVLVPSLGAHRDAARTLAARAMLRANEGKCDQAIADLLTTHRLARLISQGPTLIERLVGLAIETIACESGAALAVSGKLSADQAQALLAKLEALPPLGDIAESIDRGERFCSLDMVAMLARWQWSDEPGEFDLHGSEGLAGVNADWNEMCKKFNYWYDMHVAAIRTEPYLARRQARAKFNTVLTAYFANVRNAPSQRPAWMEKLFGPPALVEQDPVNGVVCILLPSLGGARTLEDRSVMHFRLVKVAVALAAFKAGTGAYPEKLIELGGEYFKAVPEDMFAQGPLTYRRTDKGYLLYSIGENAVDDGGVEDEENGYRKGDIVISVGQPKPVSGALTGR